MERDRCPLREGQWNICISVSSISPDLHDVKLLLLIYGLFELVLLLLPHHTSQGGVGVQASVDKSSRTGGVGSWITEPKGVFVSLRLKEY